jgi:hypothetical protein
MRTLCTALLVVCLGALAPGCKKRAAPTEPGPQDAPAVAVAPGAAVTLPSVSRGPSGGKTTFVMPAADANGHIDYAAALNDRQSKGVTPEDNANVAIWRAFGPVPPTGEKVPAGFFEKLGIPAPPPTGEYFVGLKAYCARNAPEQEAAAGDALGRLAGQPWKSEENAVLAGWLGANEKPLAALRAAVKRTHYYNPVIPEQGPTGSKGLLAAPLPGLQPCREVARAFACRAMFYLGQNRPDEAWQDLLACHRLGRLVGRGGALIEGLVGMAIEQIAGRAEAAYLDRAGLDAKAVERCLRDLAALPPIAPVADKLDLGERFTFLDIVAQVRRQGISYLQSMGGAGPIGFDWVLDDVDWTPAVENANKWFDRLAAVAREPTRAARVQKLAEFRADVLALKAKATDFDRVAKMFREKNYSGKAKGEAVGDVLISLMLPAVDKVIDAEDRAHQYFDTLVVAYALAWYQRTQGRYPDSLAKLAPNYLTAVPGDLFSGRELVYRPAADGFLLYSVGVNGADDGGRGYDAQPPGDDIVVRIPRP